MKLMKEVAFPHPLYWGMDTLFHDAEAYKADFEHLLARADKQEVHDEVKYQFQRLLELTKRSTDMLKDIEKEQTDESLWTKYEHWDFDDPLAHPKVVSDLLNIFRQAVASANSGELSSLFNSLEAAMLNYLQHKRELDEKILASLRKKYPDLSAVGIIDAPVDVLGGEVRSDRLKELKALDRR